MGYSVLPWSIHHQYVQLKMGFRTMVPGVPYSSKLMREKTSQIGRKYDFHRKNFRRLLTWSACVRHTCQINLCDPLTLMKFTQKKSCTGKQDILYSGHSDKILWPRLNLHCRLHRSPKCRHILCNKKIKAALIAILNDLHQVEACLLPLPPSGRCLSTFAVTTMVVQ